ncbi:hypothetical protein [Luteitalea sp.]
MTDANIAAVPWRRSGGPPAAWLLASAGLVLFRTLPYAWWGTLAFDADQAVVGLMAKHIAEFSALPFHQYGLSYVLMLSAYVIAPFMWVLGPTLLALKLPLVLMNVAVGVGTVWAALRAGLPPRLAGLLSLPVLMTAPITNAGLMDALGMTVEPAAFVLALWAARRHPLAFGVVGAVGFHVREFVAYGIAAVLVIDLVSGDLTSRQGWRHWGGAGVAALGTTSLLTGLARLASPRGPGTWVTTDGSQLATLSGAFCFAPTQAVANLVGLGQSYLGLLWGASPVPLAEVVVQARVTQGLTGAWPVLAAVLMIATVSIVARWREAWARRRDPALQLGLFLLLVGVQAVVVYAISRCGALSLLTVRYALLGMFVPTGLALLAWAVSPPRIVRRAVGVTFVALAVINAWSHAQLWRELSMQPPRTNRAQLAAVLEARGTRYVRSDYWTAYYVAFMTREHVVAVPDTLSRVEFYERLLERHADEVVRVRTEPCGAAPPVAPGYFICPEHTP